MRATAALALLSCAVAAVAARAAEPPAGRPDLVVVLVVDQLRADYVERFGPWLVDSGFRRFSTRGVTFPHARHGHAVTYTGPGHATIATGVTPREHGVVANSWLERDAPVDRRRWRAFFDEHGTWRPTGATASVVDVEDEGAAWWTRGGSPRAAADASALTAPTLGEIVKARWPRSRVVSVSITDRSAILLGGPAADASYWFDSRRGSFVASVRPSDPRALAFNESVAGYIPGSAAWRPAPFIAEDDLSRVTFDPPAAWPLKNALFEATFPHPIPNTRALTYTPFAHELLLDFAYHLLALEKSGTRESPDLLFVSISSTDYLGHNYGPDSMEVADSVVRLDRALAHFLDALERRFGDRLLVALTSDHGVQPIPEIARLRDAKADAGRLELRNPDPAAQRISDLPPARVAIERALARRLGLSFSDRAPLSLALVYLFAQPGLYLNTSRLEVLGIDGEVAARALRDVLRGMHRNGIAEAWTRDELETDSRTELAALMRASLRRDRSPDVVVALRPGWIWASSSNSTTHGQPVEADLRVPLMLWGKGIRPRVCAEPASPVQLAPAIARTLGLSMDTPGKGLPCLGE